MKLKFALIPLLSCFLGDIVLAADDSYSLEQRGAIADSLYYQIGGGSVITPALTRRNTQLLNMQLGWNADLMCGNFDISTTVKNQLNGVTSGFQDLMGQVIQNATGAVASLPAMIIQRANPQLYDLLTNGILQGRLDFDKSMLSCRRMAEKMTDFASGSIWTQSAKAENYQTVAASETDAVRAEQQASREAAKKGKTWVGGQKRGGAGQRPIKLIGDTVKAGYNLLNQRDVTDTSSVSGSWCKGELCQVWEKPEEVAAWTTRVVGEQTINVAPDNDAAGNSENKTGAQAGVGLSPLIEEEQEKIAQVLAELVNGSLRPTHENLSKASGGKLLLTRGVIEALKDDPDAVVLVQRLSGEMALARVMEQALMARRTLLAGMREPNIASEKEAQSQLGQTALQLEQELNQLRLEMEMRRALADNASSVILERQSYRNLTQGRTIDTHDDMDNRINKLNTPEQESH
ncbi:MULTISPECIES: integrating conjugative element protein [Pectobacteriaceae]|uniref:Integrating conjugative element protein n=1 Tax=Affinibrenneria salicis TaxID=2590031 RepID=A0A5J5FR47_9GAMM|nr:MULTISPECIES: integrating conjugative element protein [Pectobacteriaceae]MEE3645295.1 integrating conjugative element protein [Brenneria sp. L3_3C_1]MEE3652974.1 integrating conjugative element protein [Brenneria sp. HEZEL_4_2_4]KAA8994691.1 integrating conjugative element protein [Affinibrenneria salicis]MBJ7224049.1 integrating conjugative element protein [Brenneria sp. L3-3C-1]MDX5628675.1 integrating conjugative element protein [Brenneria sp. L3-3Z]